jgi:hypothetical protein
MFTDLTPHFSGFVGPSEGLIDALDRFLQRIPCVGLEQAKDCSTANLFKGVT